MSTLLYGVNKHDLQKFLFRYFWKEERNDIKYCMEQWKDVLGFDIFVTADALQRYIKKYAERLVNIERLKIEAFAYIGDTDSKEEIANTIAKIILDNVKISVWFISY